MAAVRLALENPVVLPLEEIPMRSARRYSPAIMAAIALAAPQLTGCAANGYSQFFTRTMSAPSVLADSSLIPHLGEPQVFSGKNREQDDIAMGEDGYVLVGYSSFNGPRQDPMTAKAEARALHAAVVLLYNTNGYTVTQTDPVLDMSFVGDVLNPKKETTRTTGTVHGGGGSVDYSETSTKTVPRETKAQTVTYTSTTYDQMATFWVKSKPPRLGILLRDLTPEERAARGSNKGAIVLGVRKGSPAFLADMLRGDVLTKIGEVQITQREDLPPALERYAGTEVNLVVERGAAQKTIRVRLN